MRLFKSTGGRWSRGIAGALSVLFVVLLQKFTLAQTTSPQASCPIVTHQNIPQPAYQESEMFDTAAGFMSGIVQSFLNSVHTFPKDLILNLIKTSKIQTVPHNIKALLPYYAGFLVLIAIGIMYIGLMPLVGFVLACCRCRDNCGGKMYQKQTSSIHCRRRALYWSLFITTVIILAGNICMFRSNNALKVSVDHIETEAIRTIDNLRNYFRVLPQQFQHVVNQGADTVSKVTENLNDISRQVGEPIQLAFRGPLVPALDTVTRLEKDAVMINDLLKNLNTAVGQLQRSSTGIQANINEVNAKLENIPDLKPDLPMVTTITRPDVSGVQSAVDEIIQKLAEVKSAADAFINNIPEMVVDKTNDVIQSTKQKLEEIKKKISQVENFVPVSTLSNISVDLGQIQAKISRLSPDIDRYEQIRSRVGVAICCVVLLVVVCNILGLLMGPIGLRPKEDPTKRSSTANCGGTFLMIGAGISFLFSWLFMVLVLLLSLVGGSFFTMVCKPWSSGELLQLIDASKLVEVGASFTDIYRDCGKNLPLWSTLQLSKDTNLEDLLDVSKYTEDIVQEFEKTGIDIPPITLLSPEIEKKFNDFPAKLKDIDYTTVRQQLNDISSVNLNTTADDIDDFAAPQPDIDVKTELRGASADLRQIQRDIETIIQPQTEDLKSIIEELERNFTQINKTVGMLLSEAGAAQDFLNTNTTLIVMSKSKEFLGCQLQYFVKYADWTKTTILQDLGRCGAISGAVDTVDIVICLNLVESLNAFWFSLGWCLIFFIPSIIFSIKLAKYYRKMNNSDQ